MLYFIPDISFLVYLSFFYSISFFRLNDARYWFIFVLCTYFSCSTLWIIFSKDFIFNNLIIEANYNTILLKYCFMFLAFIGSFFTTNCRSMLEIISILIFSFILISVSNIFVLYILFLSSISSDYNKYPVSSISYIICLFAILSNLFSSFIYDLSDITYILLFFALYANINFSSFCLLIDDCNYKLNVVDFVKYVIKNLALLFCILKLTEVSNIGSLLFLLGCLDIILGSSILFLQNSIYKLLNSTCMIYFGKLFILISSNSLGIGVLFAYYIVFFISIICLFAIISYLAADRNIVNIHDISGIVERDCWLGFSIITSLLSLMGFPFTIGFLNKIIFINSMIMFKSIVALLLFIFTQVVLSLSYFRLIKIVLMDEYSINHDKIKFNRYFFGLLFINLVIIFYIFYLPWFADKLVFI